MKQLIQSNIHFMKYCLKTAKFHHIKNSLVIWIFITNPTPSNCWQSRSQQCQKQQIMPSQDIQTFMPITRNHIVKRSINQPIITPPTTLLSPSEPPIIYHYTSHKAKTQTCTTKPNKSTLSQMNPASRSFATGKTIPLEYIVLLCTITSKPGESSN